MEGAGKEEEIAFQNADEVTKESSNGGEALPERRRMAWNEVVLSSGNICSDAAQQCATYVLKFCIEQRLN